MSIAGFDLVAALQIIMIHAIPGYRECQRIPRLKGILDDQFTRRQSGLQLSQGDRLRLRGLYLVRWGVKARTLELPIGGLTDGCAGRDLVRWLARDSLQQSSAPALNPKTDMWC